VGTVAQRIGTYLATLRVSQAFGVVGSRDFDITNALQLPGSGMLLHVRRVKQEV